MKGFIAALMLMSCVGSANAEDGTISRPTSRKLKT